MSGPGVGARRRFLRGPLRGRLPALSLVEGSPLRRVDPRVKLALGLAVSLMVMAPLARLVPGALGFTLFLGWARLLRRFGAQVWRLRWLLLVLFAAEWIFISLELAVTVTLRLAVLAGSFVLFFSTTTPAELALALQWARVPYRYAFAVGLAFQSLDLFAEEWDAIREAQASRGAWAGAAAPGRRVTDRLRDVLALSVPAVMLAARRAWAVTEAAHARGFDSPHRRPYRRLAATALDRLLLAGAALACAALILWR